MLQLKSKEKESFLTPPRLQQSGQSQRKRSSRRVFFGIGVTLVVLLVAGVAFATQTLMFSHADQDNHSTTINGLKKISAVGSTAQIIDSHGKMITVDPNPYGIAVAEGNPSHGLAAGDIVVSNIGNNDQGSTLVKFAEQKGPGNLFNLATNTTTLGPADMAFNHASGTLWVANATGNAVQIFNPNGTFLTTIKDALFNHPWGMATDNGVSNDQDGAVNAFFTANVADATIDRIDIIPNKGHALPTFKVVQIGRFDMNGPKTKIGLRWLPSLKLGSKTLKDVLLAIDPANSRIAAFADSSSINTKGAKGTGAGVTVFKGKPLNMPGGMAINPFNGDLLVVNLADNNLVELNMTSGKVIGVKQIDPAVVDGQGNGSALFGVAAMRDEKGNLLVFFTDDNTNTLNKLSAS